MKPRGPNGGLEGSLLGKIVCKAFGLTDLKIIIKTPRRQNKHNSLIALFKAITQHVVSPEEHAKARGKALVTTNDLFPTDDHYLWDLRSR